MELTALLQMLVANVPHGLEIALAEINKGRVSKMSAQVLNNKLNPYFENDHLNAPQIEAIIRALNLDLAIAQHSAGKANAVVLELPPVTDVNVDTNEAIIDITEELGEACAKYRKAYKDKKISRREFVTIKKEFLDIASSVGRAIAIIQADVR